jgi:hypothetical protein
MTREQLIEQGFTALTYPYILPYEEEMFENAVAQLRRSEIPFAILDLSENEKEIWTVAEKPIEAEEPPSPRF